MTIGRDRRPDSPLTLKMITDHGIETVSSADVLGKGRVVLFGVPAGFSSTSGCALAGVRLALR